MADGMHAVVFVDNHDNQRGHGGAGGVMTACGPGHNDWQYKVVACTVLLYCFTVLYCTVVYCIVQGGGLHCTTVLYCTILF